MNRITLTIYSVIGISAALLFDCTSPADQAGNSSQLGNGRTAAMLFNADGTPATGAKVVFVPVDYTRQPGLKKTAGAVVCSTTTDSEGNYRFASVPGGTYNIFGEGDSGLSYQDSVPVAAGVAEVENDTLRQPGTLQGYVKLSNGLDYKTVYLLVPGSMVFSAIDSGGLFELAGMAEGTYPVRFFTLLDDWEPKDTVLAVVSGVDTLLADSIELKFKGVPAPRGLIVGYDTLNETVLLKWDAMDTALVDGFNIYRAIEGENFSLLTKTPLPDTATGYADGSVEIDTVYEYRVVARNRAGEESRLVDSEDDIVKTVSRSEVTTTVNWAILGTLDNIASIRDTVSIVVTYANPTRPIRKVLWYDGEYTGELAVPAREKPDSSLSGSDTLKRSWDTHGSKMVTVRIFDDGGIEWSERITVRVLADAPLADAGPDTTVSINDSFFVNYSGTDLYGTVVKYRLDLNGDGTFDDSANENGQLTGQASSQAEDVKVIVQAEDDDGNLDNDTMVVHVVVDPPVANAGNDTIVGRGDTIYLRGSGSADKFGSISKYEWDIGNSGNFIETSSGDTTITIGDSFNFNGFDCVLRVTDDDSISSLDTVSIIIGILNQVNSHAEFSARAEHSTIAFNNKLWIIGGNDNPQPWNYTYNNDIWYSDNGINWFLSTDSADFSSRGEHACEIFNNNMLIISGTNDRDNFRDVWSSPDGQTWTLQTSNTVFSGRKRFSSAVFQNKIWVIGGMGKFLGEDYNDVWFSDDGITWQAATDSAGFTPRAGHSTVVFDNKLWVIGGYRGAFEPYNDVWSSVDGITWENETNSASFAPGGDHAATAYAGKIWLVGGHSVPGSSGCSNEIWFSSDGRNWKKLPYSLPRGKSNHTLTVFNNKLFIIGGQLDDGTLTNDIWCLD